MDLDQLKDKADLMKKQLDDLYDQAEGVSAKVKLWIKLNWKKYAFVAAVALVAFIAGALAF